MAAPATEQKARPTKVITGEIRGSYVNVFKPRHNDLSGKEEYSMSLLIPKSDKTTVSKINNAVEAALRAKWQAKPPAKWTHPLRDGDEERGDDAAYKGHYFMNVKSNQKPGVVDRQLNEIMDVDAFISGDYCQVSINAFAYDQKGNKGVSFGLNNVKVTRKGEPLSGRARAEDDFDADDDDGGL